MSRVVRDPETKAVVSTAPPPVEREHQHTFVYDIISRVYRCSCSATRTQAEFMNAPRERTLR